jgi:retron-type reverse transcriptase
LRRESITKNYASHLRDEARDKKIAMNYGIDFDDLDIEARVLFKTAKEIENEGSRKQLKRRGLPQGAPTSPQLANLASMRLDARLNGLAKILGFQYTRYADDLTFSSDKSKCKSDVLANLVKKIVEECRFELNTNKTCFMRAPATRQTTGLIVNEERPKVRRSVIRLVRAMIHRRNLGIITNEQIERLNGYLSFIGMVNPGQVEKLLTKAK